MRQIAVVTDYPGLHEALRERQRSLGLSMKALNDLSGIDADKILMPMSIWSWREGDRVNARPIGMIALGPLLGALALKLAIVEDETALARLQRRHVPRDHAKAHACLPSIDDLLRHRTMQKLHEIAVKGGHARAAKLTPAQRQRSARKAARKRWAKR